MAVLNYTCAPYDPVTDSTVQEFESGKVYSCNENDDAFSFSHTVEKPGKKDELFMWFKISDR